MTGGGDDLSSPYSATYTWDNTTTASGSQTVTATNGAGGTATGTFTVTKDVTAPTGQTVSLSGGPWYTTISVPLTLDWGSDSGSGLDNSSKVVERDSSPLAGGTCSGFTGTWSSVTLVGGADTTVTTGNCYRYRIRISDNVGNQSANATAAADAKVDTSAPTVAATAPTAVTGAGAQHWDSGAGTLWFRPSGSGSFTLNATASDAQSGISQVSFPDVSGTSGWTGSTGGTDAGSPYASPVDYAWTAGATQLGSTTITATNGAGLSAGDSLTVAADSAAPSGQTVDLTGGPWYTTLSVPLTIDWGSDADSGLDNSSKVVERDSASLTNGSCGTFSGSWTAVTLVGDADTTVSSGNCYRYRSGSATTSATPARTRRSAPMPWSTPPPRARRR